MGAAAAWAAICESGSVASAANWDSGSEPSMAEVRGSTKDAALLLDFWEDVLPDLDLPPIPGLRTLASVTCMIMHNVLALTKLVKEGTENLCLEHNSE